MLLAIYDSVVDSCEVLAKKDFEAANKGTRGLP
jgi:hypothetical protein